MIHWLFSNILLSLHLFCLFVWFFFFFFFFYYFFPCSCFLITVLWLEKMHDMISTFLNYCGLICEPRCDYPEIGFVCIWEESIFFCFQMECPMKFNLPFKPCVSLLFLCMDNLPIDIRGVLKFPTITLLLLISPLIVVKICLVYWDIPMLGAYILGVVISSWLIPWSLCSVIPCFLFIP